MGSNKAGKNEFNNVTKILESKIFFKCNNRHYNYLLFYVFVMWASMKVSCFLAEQKAVYSASWRKRMQQWSLLVHWLALVVTTDAVAVTTVG